MRIKDSREETEHNHRGGRNGRASDLTQFGEFTFRAETLPKAKQHNTC